MKTIYLDMDGTIVDLYGTPDWLERLRRNDSSVYYNAPAIYNVFALRDIIKRMKKLGWRFEIISWCSKDATPLYKDSIRRQKLNWLRYYGLKDYFDKIHIVDYGTPKSDLMGNGLLIDDDPKVIKSVKNAKKYAILTKNFNLLHILEVIYHNSKKNNEKRLEKLV